MSKGRPEAQGKNRKGGEFRLEETGVEMAENRGGLGEEGRRGGSGSRGGRGKRRGGRGERSDRKTGEGTTLGREEGGNGLGSSGFGGRGG